MCGVDWWLFFNWIRSSSHRKCTCYFRFLFSRHSWWNWSHLHIGVSVRIKLSFYTTVEDMLLKINRCFFLFNILHYLTIFVLAFLYCLWIGIFIKFAVCFLTFFHDYYLYLQFLQKHMVHMCLADAFVPCSALKYIWCIHYGVLPSRWQKHKFFKRRSVIFSGKYFGVPFCPTGITHNSNFKV